MSQTYYITHYYHSGFSIIWNNSLFLFDYWRGEQDRLPADRQLTPEFLSGFQQIYVFISHEHADHLDPVVFSWKDQLPVSYYVSSDMPVGTRGRRLAPGVSLDLADGASVTAYDSTDLGVSFLLNIGGVRFFHAGDLNFWHWREESTMQEIEDAEAEFRKAVQPITKEFVDVAFFPVDPRQGTMFEAGADYFILTVKPRVLIPMHYFDRSDVAEDYARTAGTRTTEVFAMPQYAETIVMTLDDEGYLNFSRPEKDLFSMTFTDGAAPSEEEKAGEPDETPDQLSEENPFHDSDLPLTQLAFDSEEQDS